MKKSMILLGFFVCSSSIFGGVALAEARLTGAVSLARVSPADTASISASYEIASMVSPCDSNSRITVSKGTTVFLNNCHLEVKPKSLMIDVVLFNQNVPLHSAYKYTLTPNNANPKARINECKFELNINNTDLSVKPNAKTSPNCQVK